MRSAFRAIAVAVVVAGLAVGARVVSAAPPPPDGEVAPALVVTPLDPADDPSPEESATPTTAPDPATPDPSDTDETIEPSPSDAAASPTPSSSTSPDPSSPGGTWTDGEDWGRHGLVTLPVPPVASVTDPEPEDQGTPTRGGS